MYQSVRAAAISLKPKKWDKPYNADKMEDFVVEAARDRPDLILTTEGVLEGYVVMDVIEGRAEAERDQVQHEEQQGRGRRPHAQRHRVLDGPEGRAQIGVVEDAGQQQQAGGHPPVVLQIDEDVERAGDQ